MDGQRLPWQRLPGETKKAYEAFRIYKDQGVTRSSARVVSELGKSRALVQRWQSRWNWVERADAWDEEQERLSTENEQREKAEMNSRHVEQAMRFQEKAMAAMEAQDITKMTPYAQLQFWMEAVRIERLSRGEPDTVEEVRQKTEHKVDMSYTAEKYGHVFEDMIKRGVLTPPDKLMTNGHQ